LIEELADQRDPDGLFEMALACKEGTLERNESRYMYYLIEAADLGQQDAQEELATDYNSGTTNKNRFFIMPH